MPLISIHNCYPLRTDGEVVCARYVVMYRDNDYCGGSGVIAPVRSAFLH